VVSSRFKGLFFFLFLPLFLYFSIYTWNWKTGHLDKFATATGLDLVGWVLAPGRWVQSNVDDVWSRYIYLVGVRQENEDLLARLRTLESELATVTEKAKAADRLLALLDFIPEPGWKRMGCRVIGQKLGPNSVLETLLIDVGTSSGGVQEYPVVSPRGLVGRIIKPGLFFSSVLLITDATSRIPVITSEGRVPAIVQGQGSGAFLDVKFIPRNEKIAPGDLLVTSGMGGIYPKGIPVARVVEVTTSDTSLFQKVFAQALVVPQNMEELLVLEPEKDILNAFHARPDLPVANATAKSGSAIPASVNATSGNATVSSVNATSTGLPQPKKKNRSGSENITQRVGNAASSNMTGGASTNATRRPVSKRETNNQ